MVVRCDKNFATGSMEHGGPAITFVKTESTQARSPDLAGLIE